MVKVKKEPPKGYYSAAQAAERLNMPLPTFYKRIRDGKISVPKFTPENYTEGFYDKKAVDETAQKSELAALLHSKAPIEFGQVETEDDLRGIVDLCVAIYGQTGTPSYDARREIWEKNPEVYYIVKQEGIVVGYISLIWFDDEALNVLMGPSPKVSRINANGTGIYSVTGPEHVLPFIDGQPIDSLFVSLGVRPGMSNKEQRDYAITLIRGTQDVLANFAQRGMPVHKMLATSERGDGIQIARKLGMREIKYPGEHLLRYELDVESSDHLLLRPYKEALIARTTQH